MLCYLLDSDVIIEYCRDNLESVNLINNLDKKSRIGISVLSLIEVKSGARADVKERIERFFNRAKMVNVNSQIANLAADFMKKWKEKGKTLYLVDATIAATCVIHNLVLVTYNKRDYPMRELTILP